MKKFLFLLFFIFATFNVNLNSKSLYYSIYKSAYNSITISEALNYLNKLRNNAGLISLKENQLLNKAALNHAKYLVFNNIASHYEEEGKNYFTGITPTDRAHFVGYNGSVIENISFGTYDFLNAIDQLFSAIYHRFGFLNFEINEAGMGSYYGENYMYKSVYVFEMGNSYKRELCENSEFNGYGKYYYDICIDPNKKISAQLYDNITNYFYSISPEYVIWPYKNAENIPPVFYEEFPDPLPQCSVSGYPISIQFNEKKVNLSFLEIEEFAIFDENHNEIQDVVLLDFNNDPNGYFKQGQFALFPIQRLDWGKKYFVEIKYNENGEEKNIFWSFKTKSLDNPYFIVENNNSNFDVKPNISYYIYFKPEDCNDKISQINYSQYNCKVETLKFYDSNTLFVKLTGDYGGKLTITLNNNKNITLNISKNDDKAIYPEENLSISKGWNLYALPVYFESGIEINKIFNNNFISTVWLWKNNLWYVWSPDDKIKNLIKEYGLSIPEKIYSGEGFWVNSLNDFTIKFSTIKEYGIDVLQFSLNWNLLGIGKNFNVNELFEINPNIKTVWLWENNKWKISTPDNNLEKLITEYGISKFNEIKKGQGFWVFIKK